MDLKALLADDDSSTHSNDQDEEIIVTYNTSKTNINYDNEAEERAEQIEIHSIEPLDSSMIHIELNTVNNDENQTSDSITKPIEYQSMEITENFNDGHTPDRIYKTDNAGFRRDQDSLIDTDIDQMEQVFATTIITNEIERTDDVHGQSTTLETIIINQNENPSNEILLSSQINDGNTSFTQTQLIDKEQQKQVSFHDEPCVVDINTYDGIEVSVQFQHLPKSIEIQTNEIVFNRDKSSFNIIEMLTDRDGQVHPSLPSDQYDDNQVFVETKVTVHLHEQEPIHSTAPEIKNTEIKKPFQSRIPKIIRHFDSTRTYEPSECRTFGEGVSCPSHIPIVKNRDQIITEAISVYQKSLEKTRIKPKTPREKKSLELITIPDKKNELSMLLTNKGLFSEVKVKEVKETDQKKKLKVWFREEEIQCKGPIFPSLDARPISRANAQKIQKPTTPPIERVICSHTQPLPRSRGITESIMKQKTEKYKRLTQFKIKREIDLIKTQVSFPLLKPINSHRLKTAEYLALFDPGQDGFIKPIPKKLEPYYLKQLMPLNHDAKDLRTDSALEKGRCLSVAIDPSTITKISECIQLGQRKQKDLTKRRMTPTPIKKKVEIRIPVAITHTKDQAAPTHVIEDIVTIDQTPIIAVPNDPLTPLVTYRAQGLEPLPELVPDTAIDEFQPDPPVMEELPHIDDYQPPPIPVRDPYDDYDDDESITSNQDYLNFGSDPAMSNQLITAD
ncbi:hypothetical protein BC833DRAFT_618501 [Globomyces pollinis-pini]|nr:hypothetical protein BC833DRAFT_618501 [Globomyces pollinis-pini]